MKWVILVLFALLCVSFAKKGDPILRRGQELIDWMEGDMPGTYVLMFYDRDAPLSRTIAMRKQIEETFKKKYPDFHYYEIDVHVEDFDKVVEMCKVNKKQVKHSPAIVVASDGSGYRAHGQGSVEDIKFNLPYYSIDLIKQALGL